MLGLAELRDLGLFCDVAFELDDSDCDQLLAHRVVLATASPFFQALFIRDDSKLHRLQGISSCTMKLVLDECYSRPFTIDDKNVEPLLQAADRLLLPRLKDRCANFLATKLHPLNCIGIARFARIYHCTELASKAEQFLSKNFLAVSKSSEEWLFLSHAELIDICCADDLDCGEDGLFFSLKRWFLHDTSRLQNPNVVKSVLRTIRHSLLPPQFVHEILEDMFVKVNPLMLALFNQILDQSLTSDKYSSRLRKSSKLFIAVGGVISNRLESATSIEVFNSRIGKWSTVRDDSRLSLHDSVIIDDMVFLMAKKATGNLFKWNLKNDEIDHEVARPNSQRSYATFIAFNDKVLAIGGQDDRQYATTSLECYDPTTNKWSSLAPMSVARDRCGAAVLNGRVYVCGGFDDRGRVLNSVECYDPSENRWTTVAPMNQDREWCGVAAYHGRLYAIGGYGSNGLVECYSPNENSWSYTASMNEPRYKFAVAVIDDMLYVFGGENGTETLKTVEAYDDQANMWRSMPPMPSCRQMFNGIFLDHLPVAIATLLQPDQPYLQEHEPSFFNKV